MTKKIVMILLCKLFHKDEFHIQSDITLINDTLEINVYKKNN